MSEKSQHQTQKRIVGLVYDLPQPLQNTSSIEFPHDACAEWESQATIDFIIHTWKQIGFDVILFPLNKTFLSSWVEKISVCTLVHSLAEGFGSLAREGWIPALCELSGVPFIGSSPFVHSVCMSKSHLKLICQHLHIPTAPFYTVHAQKDFFKIPNSFFKKSHFIKPDGEGSGMGIDASCSISSSKKKTQDFVFSLLEKYPDGVLLETHLVGKEYTSAMLGPEGFFLPVARIEVCEVYGGVYGLASKGKDAMEEKITFPKLNFWQRRIIESSTKKLFQYLNMHDLVRMDWRCDEKGNVFFLEANTLPGISYFYSVLPLMAKAAGISYENLFERLARSALKRAQGRNLWYGKARIMPTGLKPAE